MIASSIKVGFQMKDYFVSDKSSSNLILCPVSDVRRQRSDVRGRRSERTVVS